MAVGNRVSAGRACTGQSGWAYNDTEMVLPLPLAPSPGTTHLHQLHGRADDEIDVHIVDLNA